MGAYGYGVVFRLARRQSLVQAQMAHLLRERWIVGEYADRIVVQVQSVGHRLYDHCAGTIRD